MQIQAVISMVELETIISDALAEKHSDIFTHGVDVLWHTTDNQRGGTSVSATVTPRKYVQCKD